MKQHILQWNCRSIRKNFNDIQLLINEHNPVAICLQETFLPHNHSFIYVILMVIIIRMKLITSQKAEFQYLLDKILLKVKFT